MSLNFPLRAIAVDDEPGELRMITDVLSECPFVDLHATFSNPTDAFAYIEHHPIDIAFLDIMMGEESGISFAARLRDFPLLVVFVTSHLEFATEAFEVCAVDYIVKPVTLGAVEKALGHLRHRMVIANAVVRRSQLEDLTQRYNSPEEPLRRIYVYHKGETRVIQLADVMYITTNDRLTNIYVRQGEVYSSGKNIKIYDTLTAHNSDFIRIHRSSIVNKNFVDKIISVSKDNVYQLGMTNGEILEVSRLKREEVFDQLQK
jgi:two-component system LytT family response regulator